MSEPVDLPEAEALAAEHALGVLDGAERADAEARAARDPAFAALVDDWRGRLAPLIDAAPDAEPPAGAWSRIERALPANDNAAMRRRLRFWRGATIGSVGVAAASLAVAVMLAVGPAGIAPGSSAPMLDARLMTSGPGAHPMFVAAYDPQRRALLVTSLARPGADVAHAHELWIIPADGRPHSLGMVEPGRSTAMPMPQAMAPMFTEGALLAVSVEPPTGSPAKTAPTCPIAAEGRLARI